MALSKRATMKGLVDFSKFKTVLENSQPKVQEKFPEALNTSFQKVAPAASESVLSVDISTLFPELHKMVDTGSDCFTEVFLKQITSRLLSRLLQKPQETQIHQTYNSVKSELMKLVGPQKLTTYAGPGEAQLDEALWGFISSGNQEDRPTIVKTGVPDADCNRRLSRIINTCLWWQQGELIRPKNSMRRVVVVAAHGMYVPRISTCIKNSGFKPSVCYFTPYVLHSGTQQSKIDPQDEKAGSASLPWNELSKRLKLTPCVEEDSYVTQLKESQLKLEDQDLTLSAERYIYYTLPKSHVIVTTWEYLSKIPEEYVKEGLLILEETPNLPGLNPLGENWDKSFPDYDGPFFDKLSITNNKLDLVSVSKEVSSIAKLLKASKAGEQQSLMLRLSHHVKKSISITTGILANGGLKQPTKRPGREIIRLLGEALDQIYVSKGVLVKSVIEHSGKVPAFLNALASEIGIVSALLDKVSACHELKSEEFCHLERWLKLLCSVHRSLQANELSLGDHVLLIYPRGGQEAANPNISSTTTRQQTPGLFNTPAPLLPPKIYLSCLSLCDKLPSALATIVSGSTTSGAFLQSEVLSGILGLGLTEIPGDRSRILSIPMPPKDFSHAGTPDMGSPLSNQPQATVSSRVPISLQTRTETLALPNTRLPNMEPLNPVGPHPFLLSSTPLPTPKTYPLPLAKIDAKSPAETPQRNSHSVLNVICGHIPLGASPGGEAEWADKLAASLWPVLLGSQGDVSAGHPCNSVLVLLSTAHDAAALAEVLVPMAAARNGIRILKEDKPELVLAEHSVQAFVGTPPSLRVYVGSLGGVFMAGFSWGKSLRLALFIASPKKSILDDAIRNHFTERITKKQNQFSLSGRDWIVGCIKSEISMFVSTLLPDIEEVRCLGLLSASISGQAPLHHYLPDWASDYCSNFSKKSTFTTPDIAEFPKLIANYLKSESKSTNEHPDPKPNSIDDLTYATSCIQRVIDHMPPKKPSKSSLLSQQRRQNALARFEEKQKKIMQQGGLKLNPGSHIQLEGSHFYQELALADPKVVNPQPELVPANRWSKTKKVVDPTELLSVSKSVTISSSSTATTTKTPPRRESDSVFASRLALKESIERANGGPLLVASPKANLKHPVPVVSLTSGTLLPVTGITKDGQAKIGLSLPKKLRDILGPAGKLQPKAEDGLLKFWQGLRDQKLQTPAKSQQLAAIEDDIEDDGAGDLPSGHHRGKRITKPKGKVKTSQDESAAQSGTVTMHTQLPITEDQDDSSFTSGDSASLNEEPDAQIWAQTQSVDSVDQVTVDAEVIDETTGSKITPTNLRHNAVSEPVALIYTHVKNLPKLHEMCGIPSTPKKVSIADFLSRCRQPHTKLCCSQCGRGTGELFSGLCGHLACGCCWEELGEIKETLECVVCKCKVDHDQLYWFVRGSLGRDKA